MVNNFVSKINSVLRYQDEVEKVKVLSQRLTTTCVVRDVPNGWEKVSERCINLKFDVLSSLIVPTTLSAIGFASSYARNKLTAAENSDNGGSFTL